MRVFPVSLLRGKQAPYGKAELRLEFSLVSAGKRRNTNQGDIMSLSRAAKFSARIAGLLAAAAIVVATPLIASSSASADGNNPPPPPPTNTTNGHEWV
jgi:hypothetical protein